MKWLKKLTKEPKPKTATKTKSIADYFTPKQILFFSAGPSKQQVLGGLIAALDLPDPSAALRAILAREEAGSTIIAPGLALPHARIEGLQSLTAAIGICPAGVVNILDRGIPVRLFVLFLTPADNMKEHLAFLASASALFQDQKTLEKLVAQTDPAAVLRLIKQSEKKA